MDLDVIDLAKTKCYKYHKKGHISRNCRSGKKDSTNNNPSTSTTGDRRKPNLLVMDYVPPFQDSENGYVLTASQGSRDNIDNLPDIDGREELEIYQKEYLESLNNLNGTSLITSKKEQEACEERFNATLLDHQCCKSCFAFGFLDSPPTISKGIEYFNTAPEDLKCSREITDSDSQPEIIPAHDPNGVNELYYMNLGRMLGTRLNKKIRLDRNLVDGYQHTNTPYPSPIEENNRIELAEKELENVEGWNKILSSSISKKKLDELTIAYCSDDIEDQDIWAENTIVTQDLIWGIEDRDADLATDTHSMDFDLNLVDLAAHENEGKYRPLPTYPFFLSGTRLDTIMDTGAATNYISKDVADKLCSKCADSFFVEKVSSQGVRLANGAQELPSP